VELSFGKTFTFSRKLSGYELPAISKWHNVVRTAKKKHVAMNLNDKSHLTCKTGNEHFTSNGNNLSFNLINFWQWSVSDILSNATRGILAEFIVSKALNADVKKIRTEWDAYDLITPEGLKVEVKSSAYLQTWEQTEHSKISFGVSQAKPWNTDTGKRVEIAIRSADIYVFCVLNHLDKSTVNPLNLNQWEFYVCSTEELNNYVKNQKTLSLNALKKLTNSIKYEDLQKQVNNKIKR
jgi:hypothetical protein